MFFKLHLKDKKIMFAKENNCLKISKKHRISCLKREGVGTSKIRTSKDQNVESIC
jgi:hypothetical protein